MNHMDNLSRAVDGRNNEKLVPNRDVEKEVLRAVQGIRYGSVKIIIHDSKVVQIERKENVRLDKEESRKGR